MSTHKKPVVRALQQVSAKLSAIEAKVDAVAQSHAKAVALLEWVSRCAKMPAPCGIGSYAIGEDTMKKIRSFVAPYLREDGRPLLDFVKEGQP